MRFVVLAFAIVVGSAVACGPSRDVAFERHLEAARAAGRARMSARESEEYELAAAVAKHESDKVYARYLRALGLLRAGDVARGAKELRSIADARPESEYSALSALRLARLRIAEGEKDGWGALASVIARFPMHGAARVAFRQYVVHLDECPPGPAGTVRWLEGLLASPRVGDLREEIEFERARRLAALERPEEARAAYLALAGRFPYPKGLFFDDALFSAAELSQKAGRYDEASSTLRRLLSERQSASFVGSYERSTYEPAYFKLATIQNDALGRPAEAHRVLDEFLGAYVTSRARDDALRLDARFWFQEGNADKGCWRLAEITKTLPDSRFARCSAELCGVRDVRDVRVLARQSLACEEIRPPR